MDREGYLDTIRKQYAADIHAVYVECKHGPDRVDYPTLNKRLGTLAKRAKLAGLALSEFYELVQVTLPEVGARLEMLKAA